MLPIASIVSLLLAGSPTADKELNTIWVRRAMPTSPVVRAMAGRNCGWPLVLSALREFLLPPFLTFREYLPIMELAVHRRFPESV